VSHLDEMVACLVHLFHCTTSGYVVEKCEDGTDFWEKVPGTIPSSKNNHVVKDLEPGKKYKFRVKAENKFGPGQPIETNTAILAKNPFGNYVQAFSFGSSSSLSS